ncbi:uncharacterized protein LOC117282439 [Cryptotermes secundus]|uniref:uncharacterized protein LOC117282439 n=1 Tax=Cryptotermes secundus TaxID=105785 RepID=UPI001454C126|nr:uncharacterized protein LOC117282439 [Cryptotermes secundus]
MDHLDLLSHFFEQPQVSEAEAQSSVWDASFTVSKVKHKDNDDSIPSTMMETEAVISDGDEKRNIEGSVGMFVSELQVSSFIIEGVVVLRHDEDNLMLSLVTVAYLL